MIMQMRFHLQMLMDFDEVVPLPVPDKDGGIRAIRVVLMSSEEDKHIFKVAGRNLTLSWNTLYKLMHPSLFLIFYWNLQKVLENMEEEHIKRVRGFREMIDLVSASQKPVVAHNSLNGLFSLFSLWIVFLSF